VKEKKGDSTPGLSHSASTPVGNIEEEKDDSNDNSKVQNAR